MHLIVRTAHFHLPLAGLLASEVSIRTPGESSYLIRIAKGIRCSSGLYKLSADSIRNKKFVFENVSSVSGPAKPSMISHWAAHMIGSGFSPQIFI